MTVTDKSYTVNEVDALRKAIENKYLFGSYTSSQQGGCSRSYSEVEKSQAVEQMVRTAMLAGHSADDLYASEKPKT